MQAIAEAQKRLHMQHAGQPQFNQPGAFKGPGVSEANSLLGGSPSTPQPSTPNSGNGVGNTSGNQQDWTFEEQFKQVINKNQ